MDKNTCHPTENENPYKCHSQIRFMVYLLLFIVSPRGCYVDVVSAVYKKSS